MCLNTSSSLNRKHPSSERSCVCVELRRGAAQIVQQARVGVEFLVLILREIIRQSRCGPACSVPDVSGSAPASSLIMVDLPAPFTPTSAMRSPRSMMKFAPLKTCFCAVAFRDVLELGHDPSAGLGLRKREVDGLLVGRDFDALDFFQLLDARLHLLGLGRLSAEAVDEGFQLLDALALIAIRGFKLRSPLGLLAQILIVVAAVETGPACSRSRRCGSRSRPGNSGRAKSARRRRDSSSRYDSSQLRASRSR